MALYKEDIVDIDLAKDRLHRSFLPHSIGTGDIAANRFGIRDFRNGEEESLTGCSCFGYFRDPMGNNIALTSHGTIDGNLAYITLPQACYNYDGQFTLAIKLVGGGVTGTMRIVDGIVDNTNTGGAVAPTGTVPTYTEVLAVYDQMQEAVEDYDETVTEQNTKIDNLKSAIDGITSGTKNLFNSEWLLEASGWTEQNGEYSGTAKDLIDTFKRTAQPFPFESFEQNTQYTFSCYAKVSGSTSTNQCFRFLITYTDNSTSVVLGVDNSASTYTKFTGTSESGKTISKVNASYGDGQTNTLYLKQVQCEKGIVATDYVKFTTAEDLVAREDISNIKTVLFDISKELNGETLIADEAVYNSYIDTSGEIHSGYNDYAIYYYSVSEKSFVNVAGTIKGYSIAVVSVWDSTKTTMKRIAYTSTQNTSPLAYDVYVEVNTDEVLAVTQYVSSLADVMIPGTFDVDVEKLETEIEELDNFNQPNFIPPNGSKSDIPQTTPDFTTLIGKTWNAVGDSITAGDYYRSGVGNRLGVTVVGKGVASCTIAINNTYLQSQSIVERVCGLNGNTAIPDADIWTIMGGLNDVLYDSPIGDIESTDNATVYGALKAICTNIRSRSNNPKLILMTPTQSNRDNKKMRDIVKAIKEVAKLYACPVIDTYNESGICHTNLANVLADSVHPNSIGSAMLVSAIASGIQRNC